MKNNTVIDLDNPEGIDPLTELLSIGAKKLETSNNLVFGTRTKRVSLGLTRIVGVKVKIGGI